MIISRALFLVAALVLLLPTVQAFGACQHRRAHASSAADALAAQLPPVSEARRDYLRWRRESGMTSWQAERANHVREVRNVGTR